MSTRVMCPDKESLVSYLYDEFDGSEPLDRHEMERHLDECESCAAEVAAFGGVRQQLREWTSPENMPLGFRVVREPAVKPRWWTTGRRVSFPMAAAASLILGAALGMARLDVQYDAQGFRVRTGWGNDAAGVATASANGSRPAGVATMAALGDAAAAPVNGAAGGGVAGGPASASGQVAATGVAPVSFSTGAALTNGGVSMGAMAPGGAQPVSMTATATTSAAAPWRAEFVILERQLRQEFAALRQAELARAGGQVQAASILAGDPSASGGRTADASVVQRIQQLIDQSEVRQQQNLALRIAELSREFDVQRRTDLVRIEQGFGRLNEQRDLDAQQQRQLLNAIRVSQQKPQ